MVRYGAPLAPVVSYEYEYAATVAPTQAPTQAPTTFAETTAAVVPEEEVRSRAEYAHGLRLASYSREFTSFDLRYISCSLTPRFHLEVLTLSWKIMNFALLR